MWKYISSEFSNKRRLGGCFWELMGSVLRSFLIHRWKEKAPEGFLQRGLTQTQLRNIMTDSKTLFLRCLEHRVAEAELQALHTLTAQLTCARFGDVQDLSDLFKGHTLHVVEGHGDAFLFGKA